MGVKRSAKDIDVVPWCYVACRAPTLEEVIGIATDVFKMRLASPCVLLDLILKPAYTVAPLVARCSPHTVSLRDILKICARVSTLSGLPSLERQAQFLHSSLRHNILCEMVDVLVAHVANAASRETITKAGGETVTMGRCVVQGKPGITTAPQFARSSHTLRLLERLAVCVKTTRRFS